MTARPTVQWVCDRCGYTHPPLEIPVLYVSHECRREARRRRTREHVAIAELPLPLMPRVRHRNTKGAPS